jgi:hypothetical protein
MLGVVGGSGVLPAWGHTVCSVLCFQGPEQHVQWMQFVTDAVGPCDIVLEVLSCSQRCMWVPAGGKLLCQLEGS